MDILTKIAARDAAPKPAKFKKVRMYEIIDHHGERLGGRLYTQVKAHKIAKRAKRMGMDVYVAIFGIVNVKQKG